MSAADTELLEACYKALGHVLHCRLTKCHACQEAWSLRMRLNERLEIRESERC